MEQKQALDNCFHRECTFVRGSLLGRVTPSFVNSFFSSSLRINSWMDCWEGCWGWWWDTEGILMSKNIITAVWLGLFFPLAPKLLLLFSPLKATLEKTTGPCLSLISQLLKDMKTMKWQQGNLNCILLLSCSCDWSWREGVRRKPHNHFQQIKSVYWLPLYTEKCCV